MACPDRRSLQAFFDGVLPSESAERVRQHVRGCADCKKALEGFGSATQPASRPGLPAPEAVLEDTALGALRAVGALGPLPGEPEQVRTDAARVPAATAAASGAGVRIGRYLILERLGAGGMSEVFAAYDPELDRRVALKVLRPGVTTVVDGETEGKRLLREAQALARLSHPNVVAVHDVGTVDGEVFIAMDYVRGEQLNVWLRRKQPGWREILEVFLQAARGLAAAHAVQLVHRDFKPQNVLLGEDGITRVLDFGLARVESRKDAPGGAPRAKSDRETGPAVLPAIAPQLVEQALTLTGMMIGTVGYMPPEQMDGDVIDARSDQFSFCAALWQALYGALPFPEKNVDALFRRLLKNEIDAPPAGTKVPAWIADVLRRGLRAKPDERFASMTEVIAALSNDPTRARRRRLATIAAVAGGLAVIAGGVTLQLHRPPPCADAAAAISTVWSPKQREAVNRAFALTHKAYAEHASQSTIAALDAYARDWAHVRTESCEATRVKGSAPESLLALRTACLELRLEETRSLIDLLGRADGDIAQNAVGAVSRLVAPADCMDPQALLSTEKLPADPALRARAEAAVAKLAGVHALLESGKYAEAIDGAAPLAKEGEATGYHTLEAEALLVQGIAESLLSKYADADGHLHRSARAALAAGSDLFAARAWTQLVEVSGHGLSNFKDAEVWADYAQTALDRTQKNPRDLAELSHQRGVMLMEKGQYEPALAASQNALKIYEASIHDDSPLLVHILDNLAWTMSWLGDNEGSIRTYDRALEVATRLYGPDHPEVATLLDRRASVLDELDRMDESVKNAERALAIREAALGRDNYAVAGSLNHLALAYGRLHRADEGYAAILRAAEIARETVGVEHAEYGSILQSAGDLALLAGHPDKALGHFRESAAIIARALGDDSPLGGTALRGVGESLVLLGKPSDAIAPLERALDAETKQAFLPHEVALTQLTLGQALWETKKDPHRARELIAQARANFVAGGSKDAPNVAELDAWKAKQRGF